MSDDLMEELRIMADEHDDDMCRFALDRFALLEEAVEQYRAALTQSSSRVEALEKALREIAKSQPSDSEQAFNFKMIARAALGEKKDG